MKNRVLCICLISLLLIGLVAIAGVTKTSKAASLIKHEVSLFEGERLPVTIEKGKIKNIKSSHKSIVKTKKESAKGFYLIAKKKGKAVVTVKTSKGTHVFNVVVKDVKISVEQESIYVEKSYLGNKYNSTISFKIVNKTSNHISSATVKYSLKDTEGVVVENGSFIVNCLPPGSSAYYCIDYVEKNTALKSSEASVESWSRDPKYDYVDKSDMIEVKKDEKNKLDYNIVNNGDSEIAGIIDIMFRDSDGSIIYMETTSFYLAPGTSMKYTLAYAPDGEENIEIRAASSTYIDI